MLLMHGLSYGPALTRNTKERASVCQSDQVGLRPPRVTSHTILTRTIFSSMSFIPNCRAGFISSLNLLAERTPAPFYQSFLQSSCRAGLYDCTLVSVKMMSENLPNQVRNEEQSRRVRWIICCIRRGAFTILIFRQSRVFFAYSTFLHVYIFP